MAAVLACGPDAALSHGSAAALWRIVTRWPSPTHVTAPTERGRPGIHVHRSRTPTPPPTTGSASPHPARTLVDLADVLTPKQLSRAMNEAQVLRLVTANELTPLEEDFVRFLKRHRLPLPEFNQTIEGHEVDAV